MFFIKAIGFYFVTLIDLNLYHTEDHIIMVKIEFIRLFYEK